MSIISASSKMKKRTPRIMTSMIYKTMDLKEAAMRTMVEMMTVSTTTITIVKKTAKRASKLSLCRTSRTGATPV